MSSPRETVAVVCFTCHYYVPRPDEFCGTCHRHAPQGEKFHKSWPVVGEDDWCGEWMLK